MSPYLLFGGLLLLTSLIGYCALAYGLSRHSHSDDEMQAW